MNNLTRWLDILFPPRDSTIVLRSINHTRWAQTYQPSTVQNVTFLCSFAEPMVRAAVTELKFHHNKTATALLAQHLTRWIHEYSMSECYFIPMPLSPQRQRTRGHNQVDTLLRAAVSKKHIITDVLHKPIDTPPQTSLTKKQRRTNVTQVFAVKPHTLIQLPTHATVVLIDDVITTGATMAAARAALAPHLAPTQTLRCLALAH